MHGDNLGIVLALHLGGRQTDGTQLCTKMNGRQIVSLRYRFRCFCQFQSQLRMGSMFTATYQEYSYASATHTDRKCLVIFVAAFEQLLTQMMCSSTKTASLSHTLVLLRILFH